MVTRKRTVLVGCMVKVPVRTQKQHAVYTFLLMFTTHSIAVHFHDLCRKIVIRLLDFDFGQTVFGYATKMSQVLVPKRFQQLFFIYWHN